MPFSSCASGNVLIRFRGGAISNGTRKNFGFATFETEEGLRRTVSFSVTFVVSHALAVRMSVFRFSLLTLLKFREGRHQRVSPFNSSLRET